MTLEVAVPSYIKDCVVHKKPIDLVRYIKSQDIQRKDAFDMDFENKVRAVLDLPGTPVNERLLAWARFQVVSNFEILDRLDVLKYWNDLEYDRLQLISEHKASLRLQNVVKSKKDLSLATALPLSYLLESPHYYYLMIQSCIQLH